MSTDDRDSDSSNPSKSFQVGEFDRLSGFFTPVWESKRRLRSESPIPSSSAAASAPSSARGDKAAPRSVPPASAPPSRRAAEAQPAPSAATHSAAAGDGALAPVVNAAPNPARGAAVPSRPPRARAAKAAAAAQPAPARADASSGEALDSDTGTAVNDAPAASEAAASEDSAARDALGIAPPTQRDTGFAQSPAPSDGADVSLDAALPVAGHAGSGAAPLAPSAHDAGRASAIPAAPSIPAALSVPAVIPAAPSIPANHPAAPGATAAAGASDPSAPHPLTLTPSVIVRPVIPMPNTPGRVPPRPKASSSAPPASAPSGPKHAGQALEPDDFLEREPELRAALEPAPRGIAKAELQQRSGRPSPALHDKLKAKLPLESAETFARHRETESEREALQAAAARAALEPSNPYPSQVLRTLRRSLHLSTPLPEAVRHMLEKYRH